MNSITTEIRKSANIKEFSNALHEYRTSRGVSTFDSAEEFEEFLEACLEKAEYLFSSTIADQSESPSWSSSECRRLFLQVFLTQFDFDNLVPNQPFHVMTIISKLAPKFIDVCFCLMLERARSGVGNIENSENPDDDFSEIRGQSHHLLYFVDALKSSVGFDFNDDPDQDDDDKHENDSNQQQQRLTTSSDDCLSIFNSALSSSSALAQILAETLDYLVECIKTRNNVVSFISDTLQQLIPVIGEAALQENIYNFNKMQNFLRIRDSIIQCLDEKVLPNPGSNICQIVGAIQQMTSTSEGAACWNIAEFADALNQISLDWHPLSTKSRVIQIIFNLVSLLQNRSTEKRGSLVFQHFTRHRHIAEMILDCAIAKMPHWDSNDELLSSIRKISQNAEFGRALVAARIQKQSGIELIVHKLGEDNLSLQTVTRLLGMLLNMINVGTPEDFVDICSRDREFATILVKNLHRINDHSNSSDDKNTVGFAQRKFALAFQVQPIEACGWDKYYHDRVLPNYNLCEIISTLANSCAQMRMKFLRQEENFAEEIFNCFATLDLAITSSQFAYQAVIAAEVAYCSIISGEFVERDQEVEVETLVEKLKRPQPPEISSRALEKGVEKRLCPFGGIFFVPIVYFGGTTTSTLDIKNCTLLRLMTEISESDISNYFVRSKNNSEFLNSLKYLQRQAIRIKESSSGLETIILKIQK